MAVQGRSGGSEDPKRRIAEYSAAIRAVEDQIDRRRRLRDARREGTPGRLALQNEIDEWSEHLKDWRERLSDLKDLDKQIAAKNREIALMSNLNMSTERLIVRVAVATVAIAVVLTGIGLVAGSWLVVAAIILVVVGAGVAACVLLTRSAQGYQSLLETLRTERKALRQQRKALLPIPPEQAWLP